MHTSILILVNARLTIYMQSNKMRHKYHRVSRQSANLLVISWILPTKFNPMSFINITCIWVGWHEQQVWNINDEIQRTKLTDWYILNASLWDEIKTAWEHKVGMSWERELGKPTITHTYRAASNTHKSPWLFGRGSMSARPLSAYQTKPQMVGGDSRERERGREWERERERERREREREEKRGWIGIRWSELAGKCG